MAKPGIDLATLSDQDVVLQARDGRQAAYRELVRRYERPIFSLIYRMVRNREQAEDLSQETFVKALNAIESYRPEYKFSSWIFKIANNVSIDHLRRRELDTLSLDGSPHALTPEAIQASALQLGDRQETALEELEQAISTLRPEYRACILLRHVEGRPYEEIATMLDLPLGTVKTYIHRARGELRQALAHLRQ